ncbi:acetylcholine receptor subunit alpha-like 2 [Daphnia pulicaria]|uniref:acetylcholine receptor subunit alpha-like 2 n=1 Tax=Daphnia pulicaria TaxID=35523 RepID=UPI001EECEDDA|nr:acetylcholine receptor subunit alpha-like 2 [Daphnia pulicaria]
MVKSELFNCSPMCTWICCSQLVKGVPLAGLLPVPVVAFVTCSNTSEQFKHGGGDLAFFNVQAVVSTRRLFDEVSTLLQDENRKSEMVALCISILLSQTMFFLLISEIIPSTSLAVPLLGKYLLFTMFLVGLSVLITIVILNMHYRKPSTHKMAPWVRRIFIHRLPKILLMRVPKRVNEEVEERMKYIANRRLNSKDGRRWSRRVNYGSQLLCEIINFNNLPPPPSPPPPPPPPPPVPANLRDMGQLGRRKRYPLELQKAIRDVQFIRNHMKRRDEYDAGWPCRCLRIVRPGCTWCRLHGQQNDSCGPSRSQRDKPLSPSCQIRADAVDIDTAVVSRKIDQTFVLSKV